MTDDILSRYEQAQEFMQGVLSTKFVKNDAVYPHWIRGSDSFWYQRDTQEGREFRLVDPRSANNVLAFDHTILASALTKSSNTEFDSKNLPLSDLTIDLSPLQIRFRTLDKQWLFEPENDNSLTIEEGQEDKKACSPDGKKVVFVRDYNLWIRDLKNNEEYSLTNDGTVDKCYGCTPLELIVQAVWSPDSQLLFTHLLDIQQVATRHITHHIPKEDSLCGANLRPQLASHKMAYAGDKQVESYRLICINVTTGEIRFAKYQEMPFYCFGEGFFTREKLGWWAHDSRRAFFIDVARGAKTVRVVEFDTHSGATRILFDETSNTFVKLRHNILDYPIFVPLPDSDELIWFSERSGWAHLYLYDMKTGQLKRPITEGEWLVRDILYVDVVRRKVLLQTASRYENISPYYRDICRVCLDTGELVTLVSGNYDYAVYSSDDMQVSARTGFGIDSNDVSGVSHNGNYIVTTKSRVDTVPISLLIDHEGTEVQVLETADVSALPENWEWPEPVKLVGADGETDIYGVVYRPPGYSPEKSYPVLDFSCGHPGFTFVPQGSFVNGPCFDYPYLSGAAYAALGFVVIALEGRGTPYRNKAFQDYSYGNIATASAFEDRIEGIRQLAQRYPYININQVGLVGCDGITGPVHGLLEHPEFYHVGVSICMVDARFTFSTIIEQFEGYPFDIGDKARKHHKYAENIAHSLKGKLLLIHGMLDTSAPITGTFRLIDALQQANKDFDMLLLPNEGHDIPTYALRRSWDYLVTNLQNVRPPSTFELKTGIDFLLAKLGN